MRTRYKRFRAWQEQPFRYAMNEKDTHHCYNCGREYAGNFCPQCGQKATLGTVDWSSVREGVMDIWGVGTRSMTYTLWQLLLRPGYLIRDYISGRRQVSFPPVKMLLIVAIICMFISTLLNPEGSKKMEPGEGIEALAAYFNWAAKNRGWGFLINCSTMILPTWVLFHHSPRCTAHTLPQGFFIQVFLSTLALIFATFGEFFPLLATIVVIAYFLIAYYQLFGYGPWGTLWRTTLCFVAAAFIVLTIVFVMFNAPEEKLRGYPAWFIKLAAMMLFSLCCAPILAIGYAIGRWTQKKRRRAAA